ncbi:glycosyltransferase [Corallococcus sp. CA054B]|nr:glycosyltransferase [Corallococcus sp. CA054B]
MWKGTPIIGGNVGGIRHQLEDGHNGFLVDSVDPCAARIVQVLRNPKLRHQLGHHAHETVRRRFLLTRYLEQYLDLFNAFEARYHLRPLPHLTT